MTAEGVRPEASQLAVWAAEAADEKKGQEIVGLDVSGLVDWTDALLIVSASTSRQAVAIAEAIEDRLSEHACSVLRREGFGDAKWILLDYGDLVVHVMTEEERAYYALERLWRAAPLLDLSAARAVEAEAD